LYLPVPYGTLFGKPEQSSTLDRAAIAIYIFRLEILIKHFRKFNCHGIPFLIVTGFSDLENFTLIANSIAVTPNQFHGHPDGKY
jgi:hypothetical protein